MAITGDKQFGIPKPQQKKSWVDRRSFEYQRNGVNLNFTLRTDIYDEVEAFLEMLHIATHDVTKLYEEMQRQKEE